MAKNTTHAALIRDNLATSVRDSVGATGSLNIQNAAGALIVAIPYDASLLPVVSGEFTYPADQQGTVVLSDDMAKFEMTDGVLVIYSGTVGVGDFDISVSNVSVVIDDIVQMDSFSYSAAP